MIGVRSSGDARRPSARAAFRPFPRLSPEPLEARLLLATFTVTTTADAGPGSLRQAILDANASTATDVIRFVIPGTGVQTIAPLSPLPQDAGSLTIDGTTQPGYQQTPLIQLDGSGAGPLADGLSLGPVSTVKALAIGRFGGNGVSLFDRSGTVANCYIGVDPSGEQPAGNGGDGISFTGRTTGTQTITGNVISANGGNGVRIVGGVSSTISGNTIGLNAAGTTRMGNALDGVLVSGGTTNIGPVAITPAGAGRNIISGNGGNGIHATSATVSIRDNRVGTDASGNTAIGNGRNGILLEVTSGFVGGARNQQATTLGNVISGNRGHGIYVLGAGGPNVSSPAPDVLGNKIGTNAAGDPAVSALGNGGHGIAMVNTPNSSIGGENAAAPNTIAFNGGSGVYISGQDPSAETRTNVQVRRNSIFSNGRLGIDLAGPADLPNGVTPNDPGDADRGPNALLNYPELLAATVRPGGATTVGLRLDVPPTGVYRVEFFANSAADPSGFGEGRTFVGDAAVSAGTQPRVVTIPEVPVGTLLTATVTNTSVGYTSEFSAPVIAAAFVTPQVVGRYALSGTIVPDKQALLPGQTGSFANVVTQSRGITAVAVDVTGLALPEALTVDDFAIRRLAADGSEWFDYTLPRTLSVARGAGAGGSDRVTLTFTNPWFDRWMEVTLKGTDRTGAPRPDVFYFGQRTGETGDAASPLRVTALDLAATRRAIGTPVPPGGSRFDFNRDGVVNALDVEIVRRNIGRRLIAFVAPGTP